MLGYLLGVSDDQATTGARRLVRIRRASFQEQVTGWLETIGFISALLGGLAWGTMVAVPSWFEDWKEETLYLWLIRIFVSALLCFIVGAVLRFSSFLTRKLEDYRHR